MRAITLQPQPITMNELLHDVAIAHDANLEDEAHYAILNRARAICTMSQSDIPRSAQAAFIKAVAGLRESANWQRKFTQGIAA